MQAGQEVGHGRAQIPEIDTISHHQSQSVLSFPRIGLGILAIKAWISYGIIRFGESCSITGGQSGQDAHQSRLNVAAARQSLFQRVGADVVKMLGGLLPARSTFHDRVLNQSSTATQQIIGIRYPIDSHLQLQPLTTSIHPSLTSLQQSLLQHLPDIESFYLTRIPHEHDMI